jgi:hypothetical protein
MARNHVRSSFFVLHVSNSYSAHIREVFIAQARNNEVLILERSISSKIGSGGLETAQYKEFPIIERCPHAEVLL